MENGLNIYIMQHSEKNISDQNQVPFFVLFLQLRDHPENINQFPPLPKIFIRINIRSRQIIRPDKREVNELATADLPRKRDERIKPAKTKQLKLP